MNYHRIARAVISNPSQTSWEALTLDDIRLHVVQHLQLESEPNTPFEKETLELQCSQVLSELAAMADQGASEIHVSVETVEGSRHMLLAAIFSPARSTVPAKTATWLENRFGLSGRLAVDDYEADRG